MLCCGSSCVGLLLYTPFDDYLTYLASIIYYIISKIVIWNLKMCFVNSAATPVPKEAEYSSKEQVDNKRPWGMYTS